MNELIDKIKYIRQLKIPQASSTNSIIMTITVIILMGALYVYTQYKKPLKLLCCILTLMKCYANDTVKKSARNHAESMEMAERSGQTAAMGSERELHGDVSSHSKLENDTEDPDKEPEPYSLLLTTHSGQV